MDFSSFVSLDVLNSFIGMAIVVTILTEFFKILIDKIFGKVPTKYVVFVIAMLVYFAIKFATGEVLLNDIRAVIGFILVGVINSIFVSLTSMKSFESVKDKFSNVFDEES